ncbi:MAG: enoyl-CoA hydratase/isomerase family protein [Candidatus Marinimicrobia bacterium]|nr:enoyl-CoA hydratase/isomerase family protein [Candidatus Neomarinimicrobiota bacterium]
MFKTTIIDQIKTIEMAGDGPNAMDIEFLKILSGEFEPNESFHGVVLMGNGRFFSAGLNIIRFMDASRDDVKEGIMALESLLYKVLTFPGPVIAVVNGHAVGGGCILSLACDYRIGVKGLIKFAINELTIGVDLPPIALTAIRKSIPANNLFEVVAFGKFYTPEEALSVGMLNVILPFEAAVEYAREKVKSIAQSLPAFQRLKKRLVEPELEKIKEETRSVEEFVDQWFTPETQTKLKAALEKLKKG